MAELGQYTQGPPNMTRNGGSICKVESSRNLDDSIRRSIIFLAKPPFQTNQQGKSFSMCAQEQRPWPDPCLPPVAMEPSITLMNAEPTADSPGGPSGPCRVSPHSLYVLHDSCPAVSRGDFAAGKFVPNIDLAEC